jgi:PleD family two-component response regulator
MISVWYPNVGVLNRSSDSFKCVLSYGVAHGKNGDDFDTIMDSADVKMYEMKKAIKKRFNEAMR